MKIAIGADHAGFALKQHLLATLARLGHQIDDLGTHSSEPVDYPEICASVARAVVEHRAERGIVIGGSGQGEQMAANKVPGARAALCNDLYTARLTKFSDAISSRPVFCRCCSSRMAPAISGSVSARVRQRGWTEVELGMALTMSRPVGRRTGEPVTSNLFAFFERGYLIDAALMASALECCRQPQADNLVCQAAADDAAADGEHVGVVVLP